MTFSHVGMLTVMESRKHLSAKGLLTLIHEKFTKINSPRALGRKPANPIISGLFNVRISDIQHEISVIITI